MKENRPVNACVCAALRLLTVARGNGGFAVCFSSDGVGHVCLRVTLARLTSVNVCLYRACDGKLHADVQLF